PRGDRRLGVRSGRHPAPSSRGEKTDARDFRRRHAPPRSTCSIPEGQNQSAAGAANAHKGEIQKARDRINRSRAPMEASLLAALRILGMDEGETIEVTFESPEHVSLTEKAAAL
ncbi:hypothetical protein HR12_41145, partial [Microbacterium sp. SUBG005]